MSRDHDSAQPPARMPGRETHGKPLPKRFYAAVTVGPDDAGGFNILLDGRPARTPGKRKLVAPTHALAAALAEEWAAQKTHIDPSTMELTRLVMTAIDGVAGLEAEVANDIAAFAGSDLVCYRAQSPEGLVAEQNTAWDPVIAWARDRLGVRLKLAAGIVHVTQEQPALQRVRDHLATFDALQLTALHVMTTLTGSAIIALAHADGLLDADSAWRAAHVDEDWQMRQWGADAEAAARRERRWQTMQAASRLLKLARS